MTRVCEPTGRSDHDRVAAPSSTICGGPIGFRPSQNCTVPVAAAGSTTAESITVWPQPVAAGSTFRVAVVAARFTTWLIGAERLPAKHASPP